MVSSVVLLFVVAYSSNVSTVVAVVVGVVVVYTGVLVPGTAVSGTTVHIMLLSSGDTVADRASGCFGGRRWWRPSFIHTKQPGLLLIDYAEDDAVELQWKYLEDGRIACTVCSV